jgi:hypothetical protein
MEIPPMKPLLIALATATIATTNLPATVAMPRSGELEPVACASPTILYDLLNAADRHDAKETARLIAASCQPLGGAKYQVEKAMNGVLMVRIFPPDGNWAKSHLAYTLDEMIAQQE